jgi:hypothetical protein
MKRFGVSTILSMIALIALVGSAAAANPQFKHGGEPTFTDNGSTLSVRASLTGLGNGDLNVDVQYTGTTVNNTCTSPGGNVAPGQNPATPVSGTAHVTVTPDKNGNVTFTATTTAPTITPQQAGCPNKNWTASYTDVVFFTASVEIAQAVTGFDVTYCANFPSAGTSNGVTYSSSPC